jgi:pimeloyl-ACP methyl ester carboxylesterase
MTEDERDQWVSVCGHDLRVRWCVPRRDPGQAVIVMLHQGLGSVTQWRDFPQKLGAATGCAVVAYDRWGHGRSDRLTLPRSPGFLSDEAERALPELLDRLELANAVLYGHSDGGSIALLFAAAFPQRTIAVISEAAHVFSEAHSASGFAEVVAQYDKGDLRQRLARHHGENVDAMFRGWVEAWQHPTMRDWRMTDRLPAIRCPVLAIQGENDDHGSPGQVEAIVSGVSGPVESWFVPGCGHAPHLEAADAVLERSAAFLRRAFEISDA